MAIRPTLRVLTGIVRPERWPELRPSALDVVLDSARHLASLVVVDLGFCLERDEEIAYDTAAPRRNGAALATLYAADAVLCVGGADPVALQRLVRAVGDLRDVLPDCRPLVVVNRVRRGVVPGDPEREIAAALVRYVGVTDAVYLPDDAAATDAAIGLGRSLGDVAPDSPLRLALVALARRLTGLPSPTGSRRRRRRSVV